jgi:DNA-directed RNA polymerase subunit RPC12/RpoP
MYRCVQCGFSDNKTSNTRCLKCGTTLNHLYTLTTNSVEAAQTVSEEIVAPALQADIPTIVVRQVKCQKCGFRLLNTYKSCKKCNTPNVAYIYAQTSVVPTENQRIATSATTAHTAKLIHQKNDTTMIIDMYEGKKIMLDPNTETHIVMTDGVWHIVAKDNSPIFVQVVGKIPIKDNQIIQIGTEVYRFKTES